MVYNISNHLHSHVAVNVSLNYQRVVGESFIKKTFIHQITIGVTSSPTYSVLPCCYACQACLRYFQPFCRYLRRATIAGKITRERGTRSRVEAQRRLPVVVFPKKGCSVWVKNLHFPIIVMFYEI